MVRSRFSTLASPAYKTLPPHLANPADRTPIFSTHARLRGVAIPSWLRAAFPVLVHHRCHPTLHSPCRRLIFLETTGPWTVQISVGRG